MLTYRLPQQLDLDYNLSFSTVLICLISTVVLYSYSAIAAYGAQAQAVSQNVNDCIQQCITKSGVDDIFTKYSFDLIFANGVKYIMDIPIYHGFMSTNKIQNTTASFQRLRNDIINLVNNDVITHTYTPTVIQYMAIIGTLFVSWVVIFAILKITKTIPLLIKAIGKLCLYGLKSKWIRILGGDNLFVSGRIPRGPISLLLCRILYA